MITVLAGGVGAARFLSGLVHVVDPVEVTAVVNTGDDAQFHGLLVSPDLDTVTYTLAGVVNPDTGWGRAGETFVAMEALAQFSDGTWFRLGDRDLATHLFRTGERRAGSSLSQVTAALAARWGIEVSILPMSDDPAPTVVHLTDGRAVEFQEYFVRLGFDVDVASVDLAAAGAARPAPGVLDAIESAEVVIVGPSNPVVSIGPILAVPGIAEALAARRSSVVAVSPIVAGRALKGPAARLLAELGEEASALGVARRLGSVCGTLVVDGADAALADDIEAAGVRCVVTDTVMATPEVAADLARVALDAGRARPLAARP